MTEHENNNTRFTKKSANIFKKDGEILFMYKNYIFNERIKDRIFLKYDQDRKENNITEDSALFNIYPDVPKKLSFRKCWKNRKAIQNFIIYQYSRYADSFVERKILKETKVDVINIYEKQQYRYLISVAFLSGLPLRSFVGIMFVTGITIFSYKYDTIGNIILFFSLNDILMKYQINPYFNLGKETKEFFNYLEADRNDMNVNFDKRNKEYYDKFFVYDIYDLKFEKGDIIVDYLKAENLYLDYHRQFLKKLQSEYKENNKKI